jgi:hypothetical protein
MKEYAFGIKELEIASDKEVRFKISEDNKEVQLAQINQYRETALELQERQHSHEIGMAKNNLDVKKGIIPQLDSVHEEVKRQVVKQEVERIISHLFGSSGPPKATSPYYYPSLDMRISWSIFLSVVIDREFFYIYPLFLFKGKK